MKPAYIILPLLASVAIVSGAVASFWLIGSASGERAKFSSLEIAPEDIDLFLAINTDPTSPQWLAVNDSLGDINAKDPLREALDDALAEFDLEWERDIIPVAGDEAYVAVPDVTEADELGGWLAGIRLHDPDEAREVFDKIREQQEDEGEDPLEEEKYEGVTIFVQPTISHSAEPRGVAESVRRGSALAFVDDVLALGGSVDDVETVIDVVQGREPTAEQNERLQDFRRHQREDFLVWGYADLEHVWDAAEDGLNELNSLDFGTDGSSGFDDENIDDPFAPLGDPPDGYADFAVTSFDAVYSPQPFGDVLVTETITVDFGQVPQHGIYRDIPNVVAYDDENDIFVYATVDSVALDDQVVGYEEEYDFDEQREIVGHRDAQLTGVHTFELAYTLVGALYPQEDASEPAYTVQWLVTPGWEVPIGAATATYITFDQYLLTACYAGAEPPFVLPQDTANPDVGCTSETTVQQTQTEPINVATFTPAGPIEPGSSFVIRVEAAGETEAFEAFPYPREDGFGEDIEDDDPTPIDDEPVELFPVDTEEIFDELRGTYDRVGFAFSSLNEGFALDFTVVHAEGFDPEHRAEPVTAYDSELAALVPEDAMFFLSLYDPYHQNWLPAQEQLEDLDLGEGTEGVDGFFDTILEETGIDFEDDVLAQLTREMAFGGNVSDFGSDELEVELYGLADVADAAEADDTLDKLEEYLENQDAIRADNEDGVRTWELMDGAPDPVGVTVHDSRLIVAYPESHIEDVIDGTFDSLADSNDWKRTLDILPSDRTFVGYVSIARILEELRSNEDYADEFEGSTDGELSLDDLEPIRSVGFAGTASDDGFGFHLVLFMEDN